MLHDERGRSIVAQNGRALIVMEHGESWLTTGHEPVAVDVAEW